MFSLLAGFWPRVILIGLAVAALIGAGARLDHKYRYLPLKEEYEKFKTDTIAEGKARELQTKREIAAAQATTRHTEEVHALQIKALDERYSSTLRRVRESAGTDSSILSGVPGGACGDPKLVCFDRSVLADGLGKADRLLQEGALGILQRGEQGIEIAAMCRDWVKAQKELSAE